MLWSKQQLNGEMAEWFKAHAWRACNRHKRFKGSNPFLSAVLHYHFSGNNNKT